MDLLNKSVLEGKVVVPRDSQCGHEILTEIEVLEQLQQWKITELSLFSLRCKVIGASKHSVKKTRCLYGGTFLRNVDLTHRLPGAWASIHASSQRSGAFL